MSEARRLIAELLENDAAYRRDLGIYGADAKRTRHSAHMLAHTMRVIRTWYNTRFSPAHGENAPAAKEDGNG